MIVGMGLDRAMIVPAALVTRLMAVSVRVSLMVGMPMIVMVMIVVTGIAMGVVVGAESDGTVPVDEIEGTEEEESDPGDEGVDAEARIEVFLNASARVEIQEEAAPDHEGEDREHLEEFFHGRYSGEELPGGKGSKSQPNIAQHADDDKERDREEEDEAGLEDRKIHEDELHIHHRAEDKEGEFGGLRHGEVRGDESV